LVQENMVSLFYYKTNDKIDNMFMNLLKLSL